MDASRILVVDDEEAICDFITIVLESEGYLVHVATDSVGAAEAIRQDTPHLILLDIVMPHLSGDELLRQLRAAGNTVPVVLMTAGQTTGGWHDDGAAAVLAKPFGLDVLLDLITGILRQESFR